MARGKRKVGMDVINKQIEAAQAEELLTAVMKSAHSYEDILRYINSNTDEAE